MKKINSIAIYCGSSKGFSKDYEATANAVGQRFAQQHIEIIYGAGNVGLMGVIANAALAASGKIVGVIPQFLKEWEVFHTGLTELIVTNTMHERKQIMADRADAFLILPGGFGTMDEFFEILTWKQLHLHQKPIGILNINGFYDPLLTYLKNMVQEGFVKEVNLDLILISTSIEDLLLKMQNHSTSKTGKWLHQG